jgi:hypothetical protein
MAGIAGAGAAGRSAEAPRAEEEAAHETFGEDPELDTAREVALREQVLLCAGELTLKTSLSYSRADTDVLLLAPPALFGHHTPAGNRSVRADRALRNHL